MRRKPININPYTDFGFKKIFGEESNQDLLLDFVNAVLEGRCDPIVELNYRKQEYIGKIKEFRSAVFDIHCLTDKGEYVIVEMQKLFHLNYKDRTLFYGTLPIQSQAKRGEWDFDLKTVYCISLLNFRISKSKRAGNKYFHEIAFINIDTKKIFHNKLRFFYLELPVFRKKPVEFGTKIEKWLFLLDRLEYLDKLPTALQDKIFGKVMEKASKANLTREELFAYEQAMKYERVYKNTIEYARNVAQEKGLAKGIKKGIEKGKLEAKIETALKLKEMGLAINKISEATGISENELVELFKSH